MEHDRGRKLDRDAITLSDSLFDKLKLQMKQDVEDYNVQFDHCKVQWLHREPVAIQIQHGSPFPVTTLNVSKEYGQTILTYQITKQDDRAAKPITQTKHLTIKANYGDSEVYIYDGGNRFATMEEVSEFLLSHIICGPNDFKL